MEFKFEYQLMKLTEQNREMERTVIKKKGEKKRERKKCVKKAKLKRTSASETKRDRKYKEFETKSSKRFASR